MLRSAGTSAHRRHVDVAGSVNTDGVDFCVARVEQDERLARRVDAEHASGRLSTGKQSAFAIEGQGHRVRGLGLVERGALAVRSDLVDDALVAGRGKDVAGPIDDQAPDVAVGGIEEHGSFAALVNLVNPTVRRCADVGAPSGRGRDGVDLELVGVEEHRAAARRIDPVDLTFVAAAGVRAIRQAR